MFLLSNLLPSATSSLIFLLFIPVLAAWCLRTYLRLRPFPGPRLASISHLPMLRICLSGQQATRYLPLHAQYSSHVVRIGPNELITDDPALIRRINGVRSPYKRSGWYDALRMDPYDQGLFSLMDNAEHDRLKAKLAGGYGGRENPGLEGVVDEMLGRWVEGIRGKYVTSGKDAKEGVTKKMDFARQAQYFTMDAITKMAYGKEFGFMERDEDVYGAIQGVEDGIPFMVMLAEMPLLGTVFTHPWVLRLVGPKKTDREGMGRVLAIAEEVVANRFQPGAEDRKDMLGAFVRHGVTQRQCEIEVPFQLVAGSDTTATAIRGTMLHLATSRHAYVKLQQEIEIAAAEGRISSPVTFEEAKKLEYLQAVIYEGLRMQIPFSGLVMKEVPPGGDTIDGHFVPAGTRIAHNTLAVQRRRDIFGDDADVFQPERWLGIDAERRQLMMQTTELVFGYGRWGCSGKPVAFLELNKVFVELLRRFDFEILYPKRPWHERNFNMFFHSQLWMRVTERFPDTVSTEEPTAPTEKEKGV